MLIELFLSSIIAAATMPIMGWRNIDYLNDSDHQIGLDQVWSIACGPETYLATSYGLYVWDGVRLERQNLVHYDSTIRALYYDNLSDKLYSAGTGEIGWWERNAPGIMTYHSLGTELPGYEDFWRVFSTDDGKVLFQSQQRILIYDTTDGSTLSKQPNDEFRFMHMIDGRLYVQDGTALYRINSDLSMDSICSCYDRIMNLVKSGDRIIAAVEHTGLMELREGKLLPLDRSSNRILAAAKIFSTTAYDDHTLLVGTTQGGLLITDSQGRIIDSMRIGELSNSTVLSVARDKNGDIWAGMEAGVARIDNSSKDYYLTDSHIGRVRSVVPLGRSRLAVGSNKGLFIYDNNRFRSVPGSVGSVWNLFSIDGSVYVAHDLGLFRLENNGVLSPLWSDSGVMSVVQSSTDPSVFFCGTYQGLVVLNKHDRRFVEMAHLQGFKGRSRDIHADAADRLWIRDREHGFIRLTLSEDRSRITDRKDFQLVENSDDAVFTTTVGGELLLCCNKHAYTVDSNGDLSPNAVGEALLRACDKGTSSIVENQGNWWYAGPEGCGVVARRSDGSFVRQGVILSAWIPGRENQNLCPVEGGVAAGGLNNIAFSYGPSRKNEELYISKVEMLGAKKNRITALDRDILRIPYKMNTVRIFVAGNFNGHLAEYRVSDLSKEWKSFVIDESLLISSLRAGWYTVQLRLPTSTDIACSLKMHVLPPWYFQWYMFFAYGVLILLIVIAVQYRLQKKVQEERLRLDLKEKGKELANITFNNAKRNNQLKEIKELLTTGDDLHKASELARISKDTVKLINGFLEDESDWQSSEEYFNIIYDGLLDKLKSAYPDISKTDLKMCVYAKLNLSTKEIADIMSISPRSVEVARYRLRKRLGLSPGEDIASLIKDL